MQRVEGGGKLLPQKKKKMENIKNKNKKINKNGWKIWTKKKEEQIKSRKKKEKKKRKKKRERKVERKKDCSGIFVTASMPVSV